MPASHPAKISFPTILGAKIFTSTPQYHTTTTAHPISSPPTTFLWSTQQQHITSTQTNRKFNQTTQLILTSSISFIPTKHPTNSSNDSNKLKAQTITTCIIQSSETTLDTITHCSRSVSDPASQSKDHGFESHPSQFFLNPQNSRPTPPSIIKTSARPIQNSHSTFGEQLTNNPSNPPK